MEPIDFETYVREKLEEVCERTDRMEVGMNGKFDELFRKIIPAINTDIALLKYKAGLWGMAAGAAVSAAIAHFVK